MPFPDCKTKLKFIKSDFQRKAMLKPYYLSFFLFFCISTLSGQNLEDLEKQLSQTNQKDTNYVLLLIKIGDKYSDNSDFTKANGCFREALKISQKSNYINGIIKANYYQALSYRIEGKYRLAEEHHLKAIEISEKNKYKDQLMRSYLNLGNTYRSWGIYDKALDNYFRSLNYSQELKSKRIESANYNNIGEIYRFQNNLEQALQFYEKALKINREIQDERQIAANLNNIGTIYFRKKEYLKAEEYLKESNTISEKIKNKRLLLINAINLGNIFLRKNNPSNELAIRYLSDAAAIATEVGDWYNFSIAKRSLAECYLLQKDYNMAEIQLKEAIAAAEKIDAKEEKANGYYNMVIFLFRKGADPTLISEYQDKYNTALEEIRSRVTAEKIAELQQSYEYKQKENEIALLKKENQIKELQNIEAQMLQRQQKQDNEILLSKNNLLLMENKFKENALEKEKLIRQDALLKAEKAKKEIELLEKEDLLKKTTLQKQQYLIWGIGVITLMIALLAFGFARAYLNRKRFAQTLQVKNQEIEQQKEEILSQRDLLDEQNKTLVYQKNEILASIRYAKNIQNALLPNEKNISEFCDFWAIYLPKDIVSGDFYFFNKKNDTIFIALADCTGHGVPGSLMSSLGISILENIISSQGITETSEILRKLDRDLSKALHQEDNYDANDGMEIALIAFNKNEKTIKFSSANRPIWLKIDQQEPYEIQPTSKESIGIVKKLSQKTFSTTTIKFEQHIQLFMYSDGFQDQFGGDKNKKFSKKRFYELLADALQLPFENQKAFLVQKFEDWKGKNEQTDDVSVIALYIS